MLSWLSLNAVLVALTRVALIWISIYGLGWLISLFRPLKKHLEEMPQILLGLLGLALLVPILSVPGVLKRWVCIPLLFLFALVGCLRLLKRRASLKLGFPRPTWLQLLFLAVLAAILLSNLLYASWVNLRLADPMVTYAVQPARWLQHGRMYFLEETQFSGMPMVAEMVFVWPTALAADKVDQLHLLQLFNMTVVMAIVPLAFRKSGIDRRLFLPTWIAVVSSNLLLIWARAAKPDALATLFLTIALLLETRRALDRRMRNETVTDLSSYLMMGISIATKPTASIGLLPFGIILIWHVRRSGRMSWKKISTAILAIGLIPAAFAVRTMFHTGSPFYPVLRIEQLLKDKWVIPAVDSINSVFTRTKAFYSLTYRNSYLAGLMHLIGTWEGPAFLAAAGGTAALLQRRARKAIPLLLAIVSYAMLATFAFWPTWWGDKYSILFIPFLALAGSLMLGHRRWIILGASCVSTALVLLYFPMAPFYPLDSLSYSFRGKLIRSFVEGSWYLEAEPAYPSESVIAQMWANAHLPDSSVLISLYSWDRHFSQHSVITSTRHPVARRMYLEDTLEGEMKILRSLSADYIYFRRTPPADRVPVNDLEILRHIGKNSPLEPVATMRNVVICRINYAP